MAMVATISYYEPGEAAGRIIPSVAPLTVDPEKAGFVHSHISFVRSLDVQSHSFVRSISRRPITFIRSFDLSTSNHIRSFVRSLDVHSRFIFARLDA